MAAETSQTLDRGLRVLEVVADAPEGLTVTELAAALGIGRTVVYRLVVTLEQHALIRRSLDGRCRLGLGVLALGRQVQPVVRDTALPALRLLADAVSATAVLTVVLSWAYAKFVMKEPGAEKVLAKTALSGAVAVACVISYLRQQEPVPSLQADPFFAPIL